MFGGGPSSFAVGSAPDGIGDVPHTVENAMDARYAGNNTLIFARQAKLYAVRFDPASLTVSGDPVQVLDGVTQAPVVVGADDLLDFADQIFAQTPPPGRKKQAAGIRHQAQPESARVAWCLAPSSGGLLDPTEPEARRADLETNGLAVDDRADALEVRLEAPLRASGDLPAHAALGFRQAAPGDLFAAERALVAERAPAAFGHWLNHGR
jgi:hypothetical protein